MSGRSINAADLRRRAELAERAGKMRAAALWPEEARKLAAKLDALDACLDVLRRGDPETCKREGLEQCTDEEWDAAIAKADEAMR